jgi:hypothetical protein
LSKKRDALRRGIRDLLQDTSRDLVAFEGREPGPRAGRVRDVPVPSRPETDAAQVENTEAEVRHGDAPADRYAAELSLNGGPVEAIIDRAEPPADLPSDAPPVTKKLEGAEPAAPPARDPDGAVVPGAEAGPSGASSALGLRREPEMPAVPEAAGGEPPRTRRSASRPAPPKKSKPARRSATRHEAAKSARPAAPAADDVGAEDLSPAQVQSRTGVCRSYFINHECWRISNAYCNTALQVCVIRNCPVYHLHKDALERRFAKKFKHLW